MENHYTAVKLCVTIDTYILYLTAVTKVCYNLAYSKPYTET